MLRVTILGSGSGGNCALVEGGGTRLLVDAGFSGRQIRERLASADRRLEDIDGIILTHEHSDHVAGLPVLCERHGIALYCNRGTGDEIRPRIPGFGNWRFFQTGDVFPVGALTVETFGIPHDAADPVAFVVGFEDLSAGFVTDLGHATRLVIERARRCDALLLEANHDLAMLDGDARRPWAVKQRIRSRHGHLSNEAAAAVAREVATGRLRHLWLGHLSPDCNTPDLAQRTVAAALADLGAGHVHLEVTRQDAPSAPANISTR